MKYSYGRKSNLVLDSLHPMFRKPLMEVITIVNISLLEGRRHEGRQNSLFNSGRSTVIFPESAHNPINPDDPVFAFDAWHYDADYPGGLDWRADKELFEAISRGDEKEVAEILENIKRIHHTSGVIKGVFEAHGIPIVSGDDWDGDNKFNDHKFVDSPHKQHRDWRILRNEISNYTS